MLSIFHDSGAPRDQITVAFGTGEVTGQFVHDRSEMTDRIASVSGECFGFKLFVKEQLRQKNRKKTRRSRFPNV